MSKEERWLSMDEICKHLGISRDTTLKWIKENDMPASKIGKLWKFKIDEVDAWVKSGNAAISD
jgi:DNA binding domain, excisionase family